MVPLLSLIGLQALIQRLATFSSISEFRSVPIIMSDASLMRSGVGATAPSETLAAVQTLFYRSATVTLPYRVRYPGRTNGTTTVSTLGKSSTVPLVIGGKKGGICL